MFNYQINKSHTHTHTLHMTFNINSTHKKKTVTTVEYIEENIDL